MEVTYAKLYKFTHIHDRSRQFMHDTAMAYSGNSEVRGVPNRELFRVDVHAEVMGVQSRCAFRGRDCPEVMGIQRQWAPIDEAMGHQRRCASRGKRYTQGV